MVKSMSTGLQKSKVWLGALYMVIAMFLFGIGNALVKETTQECSVIQVIFFRSVWALTTLFIYTLFSKKMYLFQTQKLPQQLTRGIIGFASVCAMFYSFDVLPLTDGTALAFAAPLFITALSYPFLKERVGAKIWVAVFIGFAGVSIMANPSGQVTLLGVSAGLFSAFLEAIIAILARKLSSTEHAVTTTFYHTLVLTLMASIIVPFFWNPVSINNFILLILLGVVSAIGQVCMVSAYSIAPAAVVAPLLYTLMVWAAMLGYFRWEESFRLHLLVGAPIVIGSGIYIIYQESRSKKSTR
jgi:drug/metabolite transporter (DMT)-like permease